MAMPKQLRALAISLLRATGTRSNIGRTLGHLGFKNGFDNRQHHQTVFKMFPTPLGGNVNEYDIIPSAIFLALYALLLPTIIWNLFVRHQWSTYLIGTSLFAIERFVHFVP